MIHHYYSPLDPECPGAQEEVYDKVECMVEDPMTIAMGAPVGEFAEDWERRHRVNCKRCQEYGAANIEVR